MIGSTIANLCLTAYQKLPRQHLCQANEWDVLAGIVAEYSDNVPIEPGSRPIIIDTNETFSNEK